MALLLLESNLQLVLPPDFRLKPGILSSQLIILVVFVLDHAAELLLLLIVAEKVVLEVPGFGVSLPELLLPVLDFPLETIVAFLHSGDNLLVFCDLHLIVLIVVDLTVKLQLLLLERTNLPVPLLQQIIQLLQLCRQ